MCKRRQRAVQITTWAAAGTVLLLVSAARPVRGDDTSQLVRSAYDQSRQATTIAELTKVLDLCEQCRQRPLNAAGQQYLGQLTGWTYNRRGELRLEEASRQLQAGNEAAARELDAAALTDFQAAVEHDASRWKHRHNRGIALAVAGRFSAALADFDHVVTAHPEHADGWFNRGEVRSELGQHALAANDYGEAIRLSPQDAVAHAGRARAMMHLGNHEQAFRDYDRAVELSPRDAELIVQRGEARQAVGDWELAANDFRRAIQADPGSARAYLAAAWLMATCPDEKYRTGDLAVQAAQKSVELAGERQPEPLDVLAAAYAAAGDFERAKSTVEQAIHLADESLGEEYKARLALYVRGVPFLLPAPNR